jgi:hypothetical protein
VPQPKGAPTLQVPHPLAFLFIFLAVLLGGLALIWYRVEAFRYFASRVRLNPMQLHSGAWGMVVAGRVVLFALGLIVVVVVAFVLFRMISSAIAPVIAQMMPKMPAGAPQAERVQAVIRNAILIMAVASIPTYILAGFVLRIVSYCWLWIPIIKHLATTLDIANFAAVNEIAQSTQPRQKLGIADSFELGAF